MTEIDKEYCLTRLLSCFPFYSHRLSTIQNSDLIVVVKDGQVVEHGNHFELLALDGVYADLVNQQNLNAN